MDDLGAQAPTKTALLPSLKVLRNNCALDNGGGGSAGSFDARVIASIFPSDVKKRIVEKDLTIRKEDQHEPRVEERANTYVRMKENGLIENLTFVPDVFKSHFKPSGVPALTPRTRAILAKPFSHRSNEDVRYLRRVIFRLGCFDRYPTFLRMKMTRALHCVTHKKGHVLHQGDLGSSYYYVLSGSLYVAVERETARANFVVSRIGSGSSLDKIEHDLGESRKKQTTIVCKESCEFLAIDKYSFKSLVLCSHEKEWSERINLLQKNPLLSKCSRNLLQSFVQDYRTVEYLPRRVIVADLSLCLDTDPVYMVVSGNCNVIQKLEMYKCLQPKRRLVKFVLAPAHGHQVSMTMASSKTRKKVEIVHEWFQVKTLSPGDIFGFGEGNPGMGVVSCHDVECVLIDRYIFARLCRQTCLGNVGTSLSEAYPRRDQIFKTYIATCRWKEYKRWVIESYHNPGPYINYQLHRVVSQTCHSEEYTHDLITSVHQ